MIKSLRTQYVLLLLAAATVGLYCSALIEITLKPAAIGIDDRGLLHYLLNHKLIFHDIFCVSNPGKYFRPFLTLTFLIDQRLWGETIFGYRFTNVILHTGNTLLVYAIGKALFRTLSYRVEASIGAALLFAVHPVAVESVAWISGRTDLLATWWSLLAFYLYLRVNNRNAVYMFSLSFLSALAAVLSKETGITALFLIIGWETYYRNYFGFPKTKYGLIYILLFLSGTILYFVLRFNALAARDMSMDMIASRVLSGEALSSVKLFFASYGFYIKKFIFPFPLQFAIDTINVDMYAIGGVVLMLLLGTGMVIPLFARYRFYFFWALLGLLPAAVVSFTDIAWTPWAERYLYFVLVPLSLVSGMGVVQVMERWPKLPRKVISSCAVALLVVFAFSTSQRAHLWNNDEAFWYDTSAKAPKFVFAAVEYGRALREKGKIVEAEQQFQKATSLPGPKHLLFYQIGALNVSKGDREGAKHYFLQALDEARKDKNLVLMGPQLRKNILISISDLEMIGSRSCEDKRNRYTCYDKVIHYLREAYREDSSDAFLLYRVGKLYLASGNKNDARRCFEEFIAKWHDDVYRQTAQKLLGKIQEVKADIRAVPRMKSMLDA